jgi:hypothetical protein
MIDPSLKGRMAAASVLAMVSQLTGGVLPPSVGRLMRPRPMPRPLTDKDHEAIAQAKSKRARKNAKRAAAAARGGFGKASAVAETETTWKDDWVWLEPAVREERRAFWEALQCLGAAERGAAIIKRLHDARERAGEQASLDEWLDWLRWLLLVGDQATINAVFELTTDASIMARPGAVLFLTMTRDDRAAFSARDGFADRLESWLIADGTEPTKAKQLVQGWRQ